MRPVCVKEATAICAEILDALECSNRPLRYNLLGSFKRGGNHVMVEVHRNALPDEQQCSKKRAGQQNPKQTASEVDPEVSEHPAGFSREAPHKGDANRQTSSPGQEVLYAKTHHLAEIAHGAFARVSLPCGGG